MAKNSADYWRDREATQRKKDIVDRMAYNREIRRIYQSTLDNVQKEIDAFYGKYAKKEGITLAEAKRRVSKLDMEAYERKAARYVRDRDLSDRANEEMRLYNLTMKVNRLEMLKSSIGLELARGFDDLDKTCGNKLTRHATKEYERLAGILGDSVRNNAQYAHAIVNASFHNATFSDRIWTYQASLKAALDTQIQRGLIQGRNSIELARAIRREFDVSRKDAERLMITEMRRVRTGVAKQSYEENGNKEYQFLALGARPCDKCLDIDGQVFPVKDMMPGKNAPPMHPRCECTTAPYWDEDKFQAWLDSGAAADGVPFGEFEDGLNETHNQLDPLSKFYDYEGGDYQSKMAQWDREGRTQAEQIAAKMGVQADYSGFTPELAKAVNRSIAEVQKMFGPLKELKGVKGVDKLKSYAAFDKETGKILLKNVGDPDILRKMKEDAAHNNKMGGWSSGDARHAIVHEIGHALGIQYLTPEKRAEIEKLRRDEVLRVTGNAETDIRASINMEKKRETVVVWGKRAKADLSLYGIVSVEEMVAESLAQNLLSNPGSLSQQTLFVLMG